MTNIPNGFGAIEFGNSIEEGEQLWKEGKLERLTIYGTKDFLFGLLERLGDENHKELCCMNLEGLLGGIKVND